MCANVICPVRFGTPCCRLFAMWGKMEKHRVISHLKKSEELLLPLPIDFTMEGFISAPILLVVHGRLTTQAHLTNIGKLTKKLASCGRC